MVNAKGRASRPLAGGAAEPFATHTGNRGLQIEEPLIFEISTPECSGVDLPDPPAHASRLGGLERTGPIALAGLSEPETLRHYVRLSQKNYAIDLGIYPLGSCTMKHNPRLNEKLARLAGFADVHPLQPVSTVPGALELIHTLTKWLMEITGAAAVAMSPRAGAHGELCGMMAIRAAHEAAGEGGRRRKVLVPESAHGTNPATASLIGYSVVDVEARADGTVAAEAVRDKLGPDIAGIMLTNPNTCGLFERDIVLIADAVHEAGAYFYCDGANLNAIVGKARAVELGVDAMHLNLHKTFSTPHGGGGPGSGPTVFSPALAPFAPLPFIREGDGGLELIEHAAEAGEARPFGRMAAFHGQMGMFVRALAYLMSHGSDGLRQASEDAVLNANYVRAGLSEVMTQPFGDRACMHEVLFDDHFLRGTGVATLDFAKAMIDEGFHPMTMYFPLVAHGAMLIEPTESESKGSLDRFVDMMRALVEAAKAGETERFTGAPYLAPRRRLDETRAAREPRLVWTAPDDVGKAAENKS
jgi:glycine dehydrogenase subunit 2